MYCRNYFVHYYDTGLDVKASILSIMKYFEDIAILQGEEVGLGLDYYEKSELGWMLYKWDITMYRYPGFKENIKVCTQPYAFNGFYANRKFKIYDANQKLLGEAETLWIFMNTRTKRPTRVTPDMYEGYGLTEQDNRVNRLQELVDFENPEEGMDFHVRMGDIDTNKHVNNIKYVEWMLETIPAEISDPLFLYNLKVQYKKETNYGDIITAKSKLHKKGNFYEGKHKIEKQSAPVCFMESSWKPSTKRK